MASNHKWVLIVDDNEFDRHLIKTFISAYDENYRFIEAESVKQAIAALDRFTPDCILLDNYFIEGMSGIAALPFIKKVTNNSCPIIIVSGYASDEMAKDAKIAGSDDIANKSEVTTKSLYYKVEDVISKKHIPNYVENNIGEFCLKVLHPEFHT